ncbi:MAG: corrinoid protein [Christensenellales bacterium]|jgi:5-methyltetrahydrofolate--homocysteine methyltransferase
MADYAAIAQALMDGRSKKVAELVQAALDEGAKAEDVLTEGLISGMSQIGEQFKNNEVYVPEVLVAARAMKAGMALLKPALVAEDVTPAGVVAIGTIEGDLHDIGKNLVAMMLEGNGFSVIDLGTDVSAEQFVDAVKNKSAHIVAMSALLTTTMPNMRKVVEALEAAGLRDQVRIMIGGAPVTDAYAKEIGADGYSADAASAAELALKLMAEK